MFSDIKVDCSKLEFAHSRVDIDFAGGKYMLIPLCAGIFFFFFKSISFLSIYDIVLCFPHCGGTVYACVCVYLGEIFIQALDDDVYYSKLELKRFSIFDDDDDGREWLSEGMEQLLGVGMRV